MAILLEQQSVRPIRLIFVETGPIRKRLAATVTTPSRDWASLPWRVTIEGRPRWLQEPFSTANSAFSHAEIRYPCYPFDLGSRRPSDDRRLRPTRPHSRG